MSVKVRPYIGGGWEIDIRVVLPDGTVVRERRKAQQQSESSARRWAEGRERHLLAHEKPKPVREEVRQTLTLRDFAPRFLKGYAEANRLKPSGISSKEVAIRVHLLPPFGDKHLDEITTEDVQHLKSAMAAKAPKTVNNVLTMLSVMLRTAAEWQVIDRVGCTIKLMKAPRTTAVFHDFEEYERLVAAARTATTVCCGAGNRALRRPDHRAESAESEALEKSCVPCDQCLLLCSSPTLQLTFAYERTCTVGMFFGVDHRHGSADGSETGGIAFSVR